MVFNFVSQSTGITESFWKFCIPEHNLETQFLFVGDVREPSVTFLSNHINLKPTFVGSSSADILTIVNNEDSAFHFHFLPDSLFSEGRLSALLVEPMSGTIAEHSEFQIR